MHDTNWQRAVGPSLIALPESRIKQAPRDGPSTQQDGGGHQGVKIKSKDCSSRPRKKKCSIFNGLEIPQSALGSSQDLMRTMEMKLLTKGATSVEKDRATVSSASGV